MARTRNPSGNEDTNFFRCKRCGFPCDLSRDKTGPGSGLTYASVVVEGTTFTYNPTASQGCGLCGCKNYKNWQR